MISNIFVKIIKSIYRNGIKLIMAHKCAAKNFNKPLPLFVNTNITGLKLHLGAGPINIQGWINVDARDDFHIHLISEDLILNEFTDGSISEIYLCHVLEHLSFGEAEALLKRLFVKLKKGGLIRVGVPDFDKLIQVYNESGNNLSKIKLALMGGQDYLYNFHKSIYNMKNLIELLENCGYKNISTWDTLEDFGLDLGDWSSAKFSVNNKKISISLNLKGFK